MYIIDTSTYGTLAKEPATEKEAETFEAVEAIIEYAKKHTDKFYSTSVIVMEIHDKEYPQWIRENLLEGFYSATSTLIESRHPNLVPRARGIAWKYLQELRLDKKIPG